MCTAGVQTYKALQSDRVGRRRVNGVIAEDGQTLIRSEVSLVSLMQRSVLLRSLIMSKADRALTDKLTKTAACFMQVTGGHGSYASDPSAFVRKLEKSKQSFLQVNCPDSNQIGAGTTRL